MIQPSNSNSFGEQVRLASEVASQKVIDRARMADTQIVVFRDGAIARLSPDEAQKELDAHLANRYSDNAASITSVK